MKKYFISGGAGFIGSHMCRHLLSNCPNDKVVVYDNFSSGDISFLSDLRSSRLQIINADIKDIKKLSRCLTKDVSLVYHFASNADIARAVKFPEIDFWEGTYLVNNILEAMRVNGVKNLIFSSGSGIYGDVGLNRLSEQYAPLLPVSTYGASKLAAEALICAYCHMFGINATVLRFANVVGPNQTHGVGYDFVRRLLKDKKRLKILGNGKQSKSYIYVSDVIKAILLTQRKNKGFNFYNVSTLDSISVKQIADVVTRVMGLSKVKYEYTGGSRGWQGDVPVVRLDSSKIRKLGWNNSYSSLQAITKSAEAIYKSCKKPI
ncbi:MAG: NAD-dependent epimerase/dehydratase family protein [Candidatus Omnitrophica bacterium]|jgi:UDP-glucose 4-epimerase|nr:NAD-dependent epimerase/dehydratase family protein [Candidatus Omnitrophota bacterium]